MKKVFALNLFITLILGILFMLIIQPCYSKLFAVIDCCLPCIDYCFCDAESIGTGCSHDHWCGLGMVRCPGAGTECCYSTVKV